MSEYGGCHRVLSWGRQGVGLESAPLELWTRWAFSFLGMLGAPELWECGVRDSRVRDSMGGGECHRYCPHVFKKIKVLQSWQKLNQSGGLALGSCTPNRTYPSLKGAAIQPSEPCVRGCVGSGFKHICLYVLELCNFYVARQRQVSMSLAAAAILKPNTQISSSTVLLPGLDAPESADRARGLPILPGAA
jgi:hypothetical protein